MTDYQFVSNPDVVLTFDTGGGYNKHVLRVEEGLIQLYMPQDIEFLLSHGIIEPVPVEIPEHVVEAAATALYRMWGGGKVNQPSFGEMARAALIAAKQAEEAGE